MEADKNEIMYCRRREKPIFSPAFFLSLREYPEALPHIIGQNKTELSEG